jgi:hypothetical protein
MYIGTSLFRTRPCKPECREHFEIDILKSYEAPFKIN